MIRLARRVRARLTYANVMATIAVFMSLGGVAWAAGELRAGQVKTTHLANGSVTTTKIRNGNVRRVDLHPEVIRMWAAQAQGPVGPAGPSGQAGPAGPAGAPGPAGANGAALVPAAITLGTGALPKHPSTSWREIADVSWTQPAGTLDEVSGYMLVTWPGGCTYDPGSEIEIKVVRQDGLIISADTASSARSGNVDDAASYDGVRIGAPNFTSGASRTDWVNIPFELYQYRPVSTSATRSFRILGRYRNCEGSGTSTVPAGVPTVGNLRIFVKRFVAP